jgi:predicted dehydrogenase
MCEKPLAMNLDDALKMEQAVKENNIIFFLAVPSRFGYENMYLRDMYDRDELGDVYYAKTSYIRRRGTPSGWFHDKKTSGGGPIIDIGVHRIDAAWYLMGTPKPTRVSANVFTKIGDYQTKGVGRWHGISAPDNQFDTEDSGTGVIHFENGVTNLISFGDRCAERELIGDLPQTAVVCADAQFLLGAAHTVGFAAGDGGCEDIHTADLTAFANEGDDHALADIRCAADNVIDLVACIDFEKVQLLGVRVVLNGEDLSDDNIFDIGAHMIYVFNLSCGQCELMDQLFEVKTGKINKIVDPVH